MMLEELGSENHVLTFEITNEGDTEVLMRLKANADLLTDPAAWSANCVGSTSGVIAPRSFSAYQVTITPGMKYLAITGQATLTKGVAGPIGAVKATSMGSNREPFGVAP